MKPPWEEGAGGRGGEPSGQAGWMNIPPGDLIPSTPHCESVSSWDSRAEVAEWMIYDFLNVARTYGSAMCGSSGPSEPTGSLSMPVLPPVIMRPELRCAARLHSRDMAENDYFQHVNLEQVGPEDRMRQAGAEFSLAGETLGRFPPPMPDAPPPHPFDVLVAIFAAGGPECENLLDRDFDSVGIGVYEDRVTLDFTGP